MSGRRRDAARKASHRRSPFLSTLGTPVCRWGFTLMAVLAAINGMTGAAVFSGTLAMLAWQYR
jgi:hypothetical protein